MDNIKKILSVVSLHDEDSEIILFDENDVTYLSLEEQLEKLWKKEDEFFKQNNIDPGTK